MSKTLNNYVTKIEEKLESKIQIPEDKANEACVNDSLTGVVNANDRNINTGVLIKQKLFNDNGEVSLKNNYSIRNYANNDYISSNIEKPLAGLNDIRNVCDELPNNIHNGECDLLTKVSLGIKENNDNTSKNISNLKLVKNKKGDLNSLKLKQHINKNKMTENNEVIYYAVHIPSDSFLDSLGEKKEVIHVYTDKDEVLKVVKSNKKARFKYFKSRKDAENFSINGAEIISHDGSSAAPDNEKIIPFKRPKTEEMIQFRKDIENGNLQIVREKIYENPKYLVSNGDTPSILQEGPRYNALHVAAKAKNAPVTSLILDSITNINFISYLYDDNDMDSCLSRSEVLLDRYLNTPEKGLNETPLHLAVKYGAVEVVQVLLSYSQCQKNNIFNRFKELPKDIICSRVSGPCDSIKSIIASLLEDQYFVPVLRSEDNSIQPRVGEAFSFTNPLKLESDFLSPRLEIQAYAGPMSKEKALQFKKRWKTPSVRMKDTDSPLALRLRDTEKGLEKTGRNLASEFNVPWQEYWSFLDTFIDISSEIGLQQLENYLKTRFEETFEAVQKKKIDDEEYFEDCHQKILCPVNDLCEALQMCAPSTQQTDKKDSLNAYHIKKRAMNSDFFHREYSNKKVNDTNKNPGKNPLVYVERSCEVFGKRIRDAIIFCVLTDYQLESLKKSLETQIKYLQTLIKSYREDYRFQTVDFQLIHSRVAAATVSALQDITKKEKHLIICAFKEIDWSDGTISDDEDLNFNGRSCNHEGFGTVTRQLHCLIKQLLVQFYDHQETFQVSPSALEESDCKRLWAQATPCGCIWSQVSSKRGRGALKRKQFKTSCESDSDTPPPRKVQFDDEKDVDSVSDESDDHFSTPPSGNSDVEDDTMEDVIETPNTFIYPGSLPTKTDFAVLEAIEKVPLSAEKYPNIYLWQLMLQSQPKTSTPESIMKRPMSCDSPISSPCKYLDKSTLNESSPHRGPSVEAWERVTGPYSPRRSSRTSLSMPYHQDSFLMR